MKTTACKKCNRAVYVEDVDGEGLCVFCRPSQELKKGKK